MPPAPSLRTPIALYFAMSQLFLPQPRWAAKSSAGLVHSASHGPSPKHRPELVLALCGVHWQAEPVPVTTGQGLRAQSLFICPESSAQVGAES